MTPASAIAKDGGTTTLEAIMDRISSVLPRWTAAAGAPRSAVPARLFALLALRRSRRHLAALDDHLLRDVGLTRAEAWRESRRPAWEGQGAGHRPAGNAHLWDAPAHWLR